MRCAIAGVVLAFAGCTALPAIEPDDFACGSAGCDAGASPPSRADATGRPTSDAAAHADAALLGDAAISGDAAAQAELQVTPTTLDFGRVLVGAGGETLELVVTNHGPLAVTVSTPLDERGLPDLDASGVGRFDVLAPVSPSGELVGAESLRTGASFTIPIRYAPDPVNPGLGLGRLILRGGCGDAGCEHRVELTARATNAAIDCVPAALDLGYVAPESVRSRSIRCANAVNRSVTITGWRMEGGGAPALSVDVWDGRPSSLAPGSTFDIDVRCAPTEAGRGQTLTGAVLVTGRNPAANRDLEPLRLPVTAVVGGPDIAVADGEVDFGTVAVGTSARRWLTIANAGDRTLEVSTIDPDDAGTGAFSASPTGPLTIPRESTQVIELRFTPTAPGAVTSALVISSDAGNAPLRRSVTGVGVDLPPCAYALTATQIDLGSIVLGRRAVASFGVANIGTDTCLIGNVHVVAGSSPDVTLVDAAAASGALPPGEARLVELEVTASAIGALSGTIELYVSSPTQPQPQVSISAVAADSGLLLPSEVDFGNVGLGCATRARAVTVHNPSGVAVVIDRVELAAGASAELSLVEVPAGVPAPPGAGAAIAPGQSVEITARYQPTDVGVDVGWLDVFARGRAQPQRVRLTGAGMVDPINEERFTQQESSEVDVLFVIDNSCSMSDEQASLAANFSSFAQFADAQGLGYHIGVVTTDVQGGFPGPMCAAPAAPQRPMGMSQGACGYLADGNGDGTNIDPAWRIVEPNEQPSPGAAFAAIATAGINGAGIEQGLEAAYRALSPPIATGWNAGFLRPGAHFALIFVSDEEDQSPQSVDFYVSFFASLAPQNGWSASAIVGPVPGGCTNADPGARYAEVADRSGGVVESICTTDWATALQNLGLSAFGYRARFLLANPPIPGTLEVLVDGVQVPQRHSSGQVRWTYDAVNNSVAFAPLAIPEPGSEITIRYTSECL